MMMLDLENKLRVRKKKMLEYLMLKVEEEDYHGVADAAMDIRELDAKLELIKELTCE